MRTRSVVILLSACSVFAFVAKPILLRSQTGDSQSIPSDPDRPARLGDGRLKLSPGHDDLFFEQTLPRRTLIPKCESDAVVLGTVTKTGAFLTADASHVYTEVAFKVEKIFKGVGPIEVGATIAVDRIGGTVTTTSGGTITDGTRIDYLGWLEQGKEYLVFLNALNAGKYLIWHRAYLLQDGKVFLLPEEAGGKPEPITSPKGTSDQYSRRSSFLNAVSDKNCPTSKHESATIDPARAHAKR